TRPSGRPRGCVPHRKGGVSSGDFMAAPGRPVIEARYEQMFPTLEPAEVDRLRRFGERRSYRAGERLVATGEISPGMFVVLTGEVAITQHNALGHDEAIVTPGPGSLLGE